MNEQVIISVMISNYDWSEIIKNESVIIDISIMNQ